jgi:hypothetical protein
MGILQNEAIGKIAQFFANPQHHIYEGNRASE